MENNKEPTTINPESIGIHLSYIVRDLADIKKVQKENWDAVRKDISELKGTYITNEEFFSHKEDMLELKKFVETKTVTKDEFEPIKKVVYGLVTLMLTSLVIALLSIVIKAPVN
jgi:hypothetical protein